jgi:CheY-like chemotaxis protein
LSASLSDFAKPEEPARAAPAHAPDDARVARELRVLVVEDNPVNQAVAAAMLEALGYRFDLAANGREALDAIARQSYDVALMDCQMPEMDGFQATLTLRRREAASSARRLPVIALTARAMEDDRAQCLNAGMDAFLSKPFDQAQLAQVIRSQVKSEPGEPMPRSSAAAHPDLRKPGSAPGLE